MPPDMFTSFIQDHRTRGIPKFLGADVECSTALAENQVEFQNAVEPTDDRFNGRFELGDSIGKDHRGWATDYRRVDFTIA